MIKKEIAFAMGIIGLAATAFAGPGLTTISDVLYRVDGTPFEGTVTITWSPLNAGNASSIGMPAKARIRHGKLSVRLVNRSEGPVYYSVKYQDGKTAEFEETWTIPARPGPLALNDVRVMAASQPVDAGQAAAPEPAAKPLAAGTIPESSVIGLIGDLAARPLEGVAFAPGRVAIIDSTGAIDGASGSLSACVHVDGSSGPCGPAFVDEEVPAGVVNGANNTFTTSQTAAPQASLILYRNGVLQKPGQDYTASGNTITFLAGSIPQVGDTLLASYRVTNN